MNGPPRKFGLGAAVRRVEDLALITGRGRYTDDIATPGTAHAVIVRSEHASAGFSLRNLEAVRAMPGVRLVWTHSDITGYGGLPGASGARQPDGSFATPPPRPLLAAGRVRHHGDPIAFIVADSFAEAEAAAAALTVAYIAGPAVTDLAAALVPGAPLVWPERGTNLGTRAHLGDRAATDAAFDAAARVVEVEVRNNRVVSNYLEPRSVIAEYDAAGERFTLTLGTQGGHSLRDIVAEIIGVPGEAIRVVTPDVGGGFGPKAFVYHEYPLAALAARELDRPVRWLAGRRDHFLADVHGRDNLTRAAMALDGEGRFLAMRVELLSNLGAYFSEYGPNVAVDGAGMTPGPYAIPAAFIEVIGVLTNTTPTDAYRGAGRPEAAYVLERLVDACGRETGLGQQEIRRRNFVGAAAMPYRSATRRTYDSGDFVGHFERALERADLAGFPARRAASERAGRLRGLGIGCYIEACAFAGDEPATLRLDADGGVTLFIGTQSNGQGHATAYAQFIVGHLGLDYERVRIVQGDTDRVASGGGTSGSRSVPIGAVSVDRAAAELAVAVKAAAAEILDAPEEKIVLREGLASVVATNRSVSLAEIAATAGEPIVVVANYRQPTSTYPNGTHVAELEVDPDTGETAILRYTVVDDFGATVNPLLLEGQVHGGIAQGIGQALTESVVFAADGRLATASFASYRIPRAGDLPFVDFETRNIPCATNALGIKGAGEAGAVGACGAVINALIDALASRYPIAHIDMPATPHRVWQAIRAANRVS